MSAAKHFKSLFSKTSLRNIFFDKIIHSSAIGLDRIRPNALENTLEDALNIIIRKISYGTYSFTAYKENLISKGQNKFPRVISIPTARDRIVLRALCDFLGQTFPEAKPRLPQISIDLLDKELQKNTHTNFIKIDLKNFYPSIPHYILLKKLKRRIRKPEILKLIINAIETPTVPSNKGGKNITPNSVGVPQGLAISNLLAEITLQSIDQKFFSYSNIWYQRYVDDILVLVSEDNAKKIAIEISDALKKLGLSPHEFTEDGSKSKISFLTESFNFLGYEIKNKNISIRKESVQKFESSIAKIFTAYCYKLKNAINEKEKENAISLCKWKLNLRITGCIFEGRRLGWVFYFSQINDTSRLRSVEHTIKNLMKRFELEGKFFPKSLIKTYYESKRRNKFTHGYIPNFDEMDVVKQREILSILLGPHRPLPMSDEKINKLFKTKISFSVRELEADLTAVS